MYEIISCLTSEMHLNDCSYLQQMIITMQKEWYCYNYNGKGNIDMTYINTGMQGIGMQICCFLINIWNCFYG